MLQNDSVEPPILVVEDDADVRATTVQLLEREGYAVVAATDGARALRLVDDGLRPGLVLVDLMMPVMSGWEFIAETKKRPALEGVAIIALSGEDYSGDETGDLFLRKPINVSKLVRVVRARYRGQ